MITKRTILNPKLCTPIGLSEQQIAEAKEIQRLEQEERLKKEREERERVRKEQEQKRKEYESLSDEDKKKFGLGDLVAKIAQPIAKGIDSIAGTDIEHCGACKKRREALNKLAPDIRLNKENKK